MKHNPDTNDHRLETLFGEALGKTPTPQETEQAWQAFMAKHQVHATRRRSLYIGITSAVAIFVSALLLWPMMQHQASTDNIQVFASLEAPKEITFSETGERMEVSTPAGTTTTLTLSDGTEILLSANSRLAYAKNFTGDTREVTLVGEARFNVAKDPERPFIVHTEQLQTQVLGTIFDVRAYPQATPDVTLYEGKVEVSLNGLAPQQMQPGEQASINEKGKLQLEKVSATQGKWAEGEFAFDNKELLGVMTEIGSWYNISVVCQHYRLLEERIYFHMSREHSIKDVLEVLNDLGVASFELVDEKILIK